MNETDFPHQALTPVKIKESCAVVPPAFKPIKQQYQGRQGRLKSSGFDVVTDKSGILMVDGRDSQAEALVLQPRAVRIPMPDLLSMAMTVARKEWGWPADISVTDFIDTILWHFFADRDILLGTYCILDGVQQSIEEAKQPDDVLEDKDKPVLPQTKLNNGEVPQAQESCNG